MFTTLLAIEFGFTAVVAVAVALYSSRRGRVAAGRCMGGVTSVYAEAVTLGPGQLLARGGRYKTIGLGSVSF